MAKLQVNNVEIEYDTFGDASAKPMLLIMGLGTQMTAWSAKYCGVLAGR